jgi:O-antigen ligase
MTAAPFFRTTVAMSGEFLGHPRFVNSLTLAAIGTAVGARLIEEIIGSAGLISILVSLLVLASLSLFSRRESLQWQGLLPLSMLFFLAWAGFSIFWSQYQWATLGGLFLLLIYSVLGFYVALLRDLIQIVRAFGDVLRVTLAISIVLEVFSGLLIDMPIRFLGIQGDIAKLGPIQGIMGTRNQLALVALIAAITFGTELRTRSVSKGLGIGSLILAALSIALSRSSILGGVVVVAGAAVLALYLVRRVSPARRTFWQLGLLSTGLVAAIVAWVFRSSLIQLFNAAGDLNHRLDIWRQTWLLIQVNFLSGWGWLGYWNPSIPPYTAFPPPSQHVPSSALNAFLDVWLQLGLIGLGVFVGLIGLTFVRSWLLAGRQRSVVFAWPALVLVALIATSLFESSILVEYGWLTFVICSVKAARELSWRSAFATPLASEFD